MTYLITGAHGFIGTHLTRECLQAGIRVIAYDLVRPRWPEPGLEGAVVVEGDILEPTRLIETMQAHKVQVVIHLVAYGAGDVGREIGLVKAGDYNPLKGAEVNVLGALTVFEAADVLWDMVYVKDAAHAFFLAAQVKTPEHRIFNVTGHTARPKDMVEVVKRLVPGVHVEVVPGGEPVYPYGLPGKRADRELGFRPRYSLEEAAQDYLEDLRNRMKA